MVKLHSFQFSENPSVLKCGTLSKPTSDLCIWACTLWCRENEPIPLTGLARKWMKKVSGEWVDALVNNSLETSEVLWGEVCQLTTLRWDAVSVQPQPPHWSYCLLDENEYLPGILPQPHLKCLFCFYSQWLSIKSRLTFPQFLGKKYFCNT